MEDFIDGCSEALEESVSQRTIEGDLHMMRYDSKLGFGAPIDYDRSRASYVYTDDSFSIDGISLDSEEVRAVRFAASILKQHSQVNIIEEFQGAVRKIVDAVNMHRMSSDGSDIDFLVLEKAPLIKGTEHLETLIDCIGERTVIQLTYQKFFADEPAEYIVYPHLLKEYHGRWYLVAFSEDKQEFRIFGLERIEDIKQLTSRVYLRKQIDFEDFFRHSIGITTTMEEPTVIVVAFSEQQSKYLATQPIHDTQAPIKEVDGRLHWQFTIIPTFEFTSMLLGWAGEVEVISPPEYREKIAKLLKETLGQYEKG